MLDMILSNSSMNFAFYLYYEIGEKCIISLKIRKDTALGSVFQTKQS